MWKWSIKSNFVVFLQIGDKWLPISFKLVTVVEYITIYVRVDFNYNMQISMGAINWNVFVNRGPLSLNLKIEEKFRIVFSVCETSIQVSTSKLINLVDFGQNIGTDGFFVRLTSAFLAIWSGIKLMIFYVIDGYWTGDAVGPERNRFIDGSTHFNNIPTLSAA